LAKHRYKHLHDKIIANLEKNNFSQTFIYEILHYMTTTFEKSNIDHILEHFDFCKDAFFYLQNGIIVNDRKIDSNIRDLILELSIVLEAKKFSFQKKSLLEIKNIDIFLEYSYELQKNLYGFKIIDEKKYNEIYQTILYNRNVLLSKYLLNFYFQQLQKDKELNNFVVELIKKYEFTIEQTKDNEEDYNYFSLILDYIIELYNEGLSKNYINSILNNIYKNLIVSKNQNIIMYLEDIKNKIEKLNNKTKKRITVFNNSDFNKLSNILNYSSNNNDFYYDENIITIDPPQAENLDDALSLKIDNKGNYEVGLYITDVSSEIMFGTNLDAMAFESFQSHNRKCSIFPKEISLGKCSLLPEQNRKIVACFIKFNQNGDMLSYEFNKGYINIKAENRFSYERANKILANKFFDDKSTDTLRHLSDLSKKGFFSKIKHNVEYSPSEMIIAKFMSMYNILVAQEMISKKIPAIYRARDYSGDLDLTVVSPYLALLTSNNQNLKNNSRVILSQPYYTTDLKTHCDKNSQFYIQVTSPLRRYFDLINQRLFSVVFDEESLNLIMNKDYEIALKKYLGSLVTLNNEKNVYILKRDKIHF